MWCAHHFRSVRSCVSWYSAAGVTYLPLDTPCQGSVLTGTATLLVSVPRGYHAPCSYCICDSWSVSYSCFICHSYFICDSCYVSCSLLCTLSNSHCLASSPLVLEHPRSWSSCPVCSACSRMGVSSGSACGGILADLRCSPSSREDCHLATVWSKCCWGWQSKSLTVANGSGIGATICTGILFTALACLAWSSISRRSGSLS